ncbi:adenosylcobinamide-phosphate synthase CbiB [Desulfolucanica intricata]|uniref:adenosylcobinamide-phosphate synthase CbiB n=1 Tax=Desulfolucanica intricata TaxID=1285191 RepID=UPI000833B0E7|nr:adenosylcobinamide-phosphate synthase CbiB [Desulfolucanica intricata]
MVVNIILAYFIDLIIGDPRWLTHPVVLIGKLISFLEKILFKFLRKPLALRIGGVFLVIVVVVSSYFFTWAIIKTLTEINGILGRVAEIWLISTTLATKSLAGAAREIYNLLQKGDIKEARIKVGWIVGRDTENMESQQLTRATVETVAENIVDGVLSPLFFAILGGAPLAMAYKAVNTLDSMVGYKNEKYKNLGWASARLDDLANFFPARWAGLLLLCTAGLLGYRIKNVYQAVRRYAVKHPSPNSGIPESAVAGALGVRLGGLNYYGGQASFRAYMGEDNFPLEDVHIIKTIRMMYISSALGVISGLFFGGIALILLNKSLV